MMLWWAHPWTGALNYMFMSSNWTGLPMNGTRWHITCPITQISCRKIMTSISFWGKLYFVFGQEKVWWQEKRFFCVYKKTLWVVWNGEMIRKYELSVPCLTGHTPRLTFQRFPQFNTKLRLYVHLQSSFVSINTATLYYSISNTFLMYISTMALGQHTTRTSRSAMLGGNSFS